MAELKRWSVTYTKHMKQKRKVYQDGFLELDASINKVMLYDDCKKLLESRLLKKDEEVSSGETLTFNSFLVDVNEADSAEADCKPIPSFNSQEKETKFNEKRSGPFVNSRSKPQANLSPSIKIIREFKSRELHKYGAAQSSPETVKTSKIEWQVLYTTQLTQKAKKYHDGFLQLAISGSYGKQIILLDASRNQLDCRFLKKDEVIAVGESMAFDAYLVDIGEREGDHKPVIDFHFKENGRKVVREAGIKQEQSNAVTTAKTSGKEWKVLYTAQITQKAKKYHDGFLQLAYCGSQRRQAQLFDATRKVIDSKFLKNNEVLRSGESFSFVTHLVHIGEPEENHEPSVDLNFNGNSGCIQKTEKLGRGDDCVIMDSLEVKEWNALYTSQIIQKVKKFNAGILRLTFSGSYHKKVSLLDENKTMLSSKFISLSEDIRTGSLFELPEYLVEVGRPYAICGEGEGKSPNKECLKKGSDSNHSISSVEKTKPSRGVLTNKPLRNAYQILSILQKPMARERVLSVHDDNSMERSVEFIKRSQTSDAIMVDFSEDGRPSQPHRLVKLEPNENIYTQNPPDLMSSKATSSDSDGQVTDPIGMRNSGQLYSRNLEGDTRQQGTGSASDKSRLSSCVTHDAVDEKLSSSKDPTPEQIKECPSFDLGF